MEFTYYNPVKLYHGANQLAAVAKQVREYGKKTLLITGSASFHQNGYYDELAHAFHMEGIVIFELAGNRKPLLSTVRAGMSLVESKQIDSVIGIGGGVCMDLAKTIAFGVTQKADIWDLLSGSAQPDAGEHIPGGTIVTFPSSGSDMNGSTQITNDATGESAGLSGVFPNFSWQNPEYLMSIETDALISSQFASFVELSLGYIGQGTSNIAEAISATLMKTILENLERALKEPDDWDSRETLMIANSLAVNGLTTMGKTLDWILYPLNAAIMEYMGIAYRPCITTLFPYWIKLIYDGQPEIKRYFHEVFAVPIDDRNDDEILSEGLGAIFDLYQRYGIAIRLCDIRPITEDPTRLQRLLRPLSGMQSISKELSQELIRAMVSEAINGIPVRG